MTKLLERAQSLRDVRNSAWLLITLLTLFMAINFADKAVLGQTSVALMRDLGLTHSEFGLLGASYYTLFFVGGVFGGWLADRVDTRWLLGYMVLLWSLCQLPVALAASVPVLVASRILLGLTEGPAYPGALVAAYGRFPDRDRALPTALMDIGGVVGFGLLAPTVVYGIARGSWQGAFLILGTLGVAWCIAWFASVRPAPKRRPPRIGIAPVLRLRTLLTNRTVLGVMLSGFAANWLLTLALIWLPAYLREVVGYAPEEVGLLIGAIALAQVVVLLGVGFFSQRLGRLGVSSRRARAWPAAIGVALAGLLTTTLAHSTGSRLPAVLAVLAFSICSTIFALGPVLVAEITPTVERGAVLGVANAVATSAGPLAPLLTGLLVDSGASTEAGFRFGFSIAGALVTVMAIAGFVLTDNK